MPSLMRLADGTAALAKREKLANEAVAPNAAVPPMKCRRVRAVVCPFMGGKYYDATGLCRELGPAIDLTRPRGKPNLAPLWLGRRWGHTARHVPRGPHVT